MLDKKSRGNFTLLILFSIFSGLLDAAGIGSIMPFLALLMTPNAVFQNEYFILIFGIIENSEYQKYQVIIGYYFNNISCNSMSRFVALFSN